MTKLYNFAFNELHDKITTIDTKTEELRLQRAKLIQEAGICQTTYNYRVRTMHKR